MKINVSRFMKIFLFLCIVGILFSTELFAWSTVNGVAISTFTVNQLYPLLTSDGAGGAIIVWDDARNENEYDIYAQRVNSQGSTVWTTNGVAICTVKYGAPPAIISDDSGGAFITWADQYYENYYSIFAQHVNAQGSTLWTNQGVTITTTDTGYYPMLVSDSAGGVIIAWLDLRTSNPGTYAQRVNSQGSTLWTTNGVAICTVAKGGGYPEIASDGAGGAIMTWEDGRDASVDIFTGGEMNFIIYSQRVNGQGSTLWTNGGVLTGTAGGVSDKNALYPTIISDNMGGAFITEVITNSELMENGGPYTGNIYAQRVNSEGTVLWYTVSTSFYYTGEYPMLASDTAGGAYVTWYDYRSTTYPYESSTAQIYMQRVNSSGSTYWTLNGIVICTALQNPIYPMITEDGSGGAIVTWEDVANFTTDNIYAQHVNSTGSTLWTLNGVAISTAASNQINPTIISDGSGGAIITWAENNRENFLYNIYAQQVNGEGLVPVEDWYLYAGDWK
jgi:hypothetical protein